MGLLGRRPLVNALRIFWILVILWYEEAVFVHSARKCRWPEGILHSESTATHVLVVADPQILDHRSYPERSAFLTYLSQVFTDINLRKSWRAALRTHPDVVLFLGDMMDNGREVMTDDEYARYYHRFNNTFKMDPKIPRYFIPGNHDTGLGAPSVFSSDARSRYISHFGSTNTVMTLAGHTFVLLDAPGFVEEDHQRANQGQSFDKWQPVGAGPVEFVTQSGRRDQNIPLILLTHIPLSRRDGSNCGPLRERGTIRQGAGVGYQNTIGEPATEFILKNLHPSLILSGDDHDYCEYTHEYQTDDQLHTHSVREVTVKSLSMAMGIRKPGFQLLSLVQPVPSQPTHADTLCLMPDQVGIYISRYVPFFMMSIMLLCISQLFFPEKPTSYNRTTGPLNLTSKELPLPSSASKNRQRGLTINLFGIRRRIRFVGRLVDCIYCFSVRRVLNLGQNIRDVVVVPVGLFLVMCWWTLSG